MKTVEITETILREIQRQLKDALENAARDRELTHRAVARTARFEVRLDAIASDIRSRLADMAADINTIRSDIASIDIKLASLPNIETAIRNLQENGQ